MKRTRFRTLTGALALLMAATLPATAADLHEPHRGSTCAEGEIGIWHFVNNQTGGVMEPGTITATFDGEEVTQSADKVTRGTQHFWFMGTEESPYTTLESATTGLPGKLVLSEVSCGPADPEDPEEPVDEL